ncbi:protein trichome birefringence-like 19 isoform X1 [Camellia sinensis]|uniref:protein trichome birefringence-like 19 isoform X1 n=1 Tax=Camellia sinensis TaxID=4442 RepID=UPI00103588D5|nr:protein trichome birefringence-like 19 isoform X1 [Camellia sinensis]
MKVSVLELHNAKKTHLKDLRKVILVVLTFVLFTIVHLHLCNNWSTFSLQFPVISANGSARLTLKHNRCNIFKGNWVPYAEGPYYYTNSNKCVVDDRQNCIKFGRPDSGYMKWRWKPDGCELPRFDAAQFLELVRGKSMVFVGDSVGRNQVESLMCLLATMASPVDAPSVGGAIRCWLYIDYNFKLAIIWSPNLVKLSVPNQNGSSIVGVLNLYLDKVDEAWAAQIEHFDYVIISAGQWFSRPLIYHENGKIVGCHVCKNESITSLSRYYGYRMALRTAFKAILSLPNFKGVTFLRSFSPTHFGGEDWVKGGNCSQTRPFPQQEMESDESNLEFYLTQVDEFRVAEREAGTRGLKFRWLDITEAMVMRPDGHPYHYGHPPNKEKHIADCLHWCLPGPIDSWNEFLLHMLKMEGQESVDATL